MTIVAVLLASLVCGWLSANGRAMPALALTLLVLLVLYVIRLPENGLALAAFAIVAVPYNTVFGRPQFGAVRLFAMLAMAGVLALAVRRVWPAIRPRLADVAAGGFVIFTLISWLLSPHVHGSLTATVNFVTPIGFYVAGRLFGARSGARITAFLLAGGTVGALTIAYEMFVARRPLFSNSDTYLWNQTNSSLFRPAGVFASPPAASTILAMIVVAALPLRHGTVGGRRMLLHLGIAICLFGEMLTLTRGPTIGLFVALIVYVLLVAPTPRTVLSLALGLSAAAFMVIALVLPAVGHTTLYQEALVRKGNFAARQSYWHDAFPRITNSSRHLIFGHGINSLVIGHPWLPGQLDPDVASSPLLFSDGTHSQYVRTLFEEGVVGIALLVAWLGGALLIGFRRLRTIPVGVQRAELAAGIGATLCFAIAGLATDIARHPVAFAVVGLIMGMLVSRAQADWREADGET